MIILVIIVLLIIILGFQYRSHNTWLQVNPSGNLEEFGSTSPGTLIQLATSSTDPYNSLYPYYPLYPYTSYRNWYNRPYPYYYYPYNRPYHRFYNVL